MQLALAFTRKNLLLDGALTVLACFVLGLQLKLKSVKGTWIMLIVSALIQMGLQPWLASLQASTEVHRCARASGRR